MNPSWWWSWLRVWVTEKRFVKMNYRVRNRNATTLPLFLFFCKPPPSLRLEKAGRLIRLRGDSISPGLRIHSPGLQIHAHTACRVPLPLSPISDEEVDDGGCAGVSRGRLTRGDMANADRSSRPSLPCPPEVWPSQPARRSEPTRTRPTVFSFPTSPSIAPHFHTP